MVTTVQGESSPTLAVSVVVYRPQRELLWRTLRSLAEALRVAGMRAVPVCVVDNSPQLTPGLLPPELLDDEVLQVCVRHGHGNVGFGAGHNLGLRDAEAAFVLVLNPDVEFAPDALQAAFAFLAAEPQCGVLVPEVFGADGARQHLCKRYPGVLTLLLRGFAPRWLRHLAAARLARYELRDAPVGVLWDPPLLSGCFVLARRDLWQASGGFDERFFLYFEDFDWSMRIAPLTRRARVPAVRIVHHGGEAARKGWQHVRLFMVSGARFFARHGWRWW